MTNLRIAPPKRSRLTRHIRFWNYFNSGFTLAETLISLGIIGVVAAVTIPTLVSNHKKHVIETRLAKFYSIMNSAIKASEAENGSMQSWEPIPNTGSTNNQPNSLPWFNKYLNPYLRTLKVLPDKNKTATIVYFADGSCFRLVGQGIQFFPEAKKFKDPRELKDSGIEWFSFFFHPSDENDTENWKWAVKYHKDKGVEPYKWSWDGNIETLINDSTNGCNKDNTNERAYCTALIQANGWKIPKNYPLKF